MELGGKLVRVAIPFRSGLTFRLRGNGAGPIPWVGRRNPLSFGSHLPTPLGDSMSLHYGLSQSPFVRVSPSDLNTTRRYVRTDPMVAIPFRSGLTFRRAHNDDGAAGVARVAIPFRSGLTFRPGVWRLRVSRVRVAIPFRSGLTFRRGTQVSRLAAQQAGGRNPLSFGSHLPTIQG